MSKKQAPVRKLPAEPDLKQLKRQAKELLEAFRAGDPTAAAEVQSHVRDAEPATAALHQAQAALARSYGYESWRKLRAFLDGANIKRLIQRVRQGNVEAVGRILDARPELIHMDAASNNEHRALHYAVLDRLPEMVALLMVRGADARKGIYPHRDATGALTIAKERGYDEIVEIIEQEEARRRQSAAPADSVQELTEALMRGDEDRAIQLMEGEPQLITARIRGSWTPLHLAAGSRNVRMTAWLLEQGAAVDARGDEDKTPLDIAAGGGWRQPGGAEQFAAVAKLLIEQGAQMTARAAVALGEDSWLRELHAEGRLTNPIEEWGGLLSIAVRHDRLETLKLLLELELDPNERRRVDGLEPPEDSWGMPLWHAASSGKHEAARILLEAGGDPNGSVYASGTPTSHAFGQRDPEMIERLKSFGGKVDAITAGLYRSTDLARRMLDGEIDFKEADGGYAGDTIAEQLLWAAACGGDPEIVRMALDQVDWGRTDKRWYPILEQPLRFWNHASGFWTTPQWDRTTYLKCFRLVLARCDVNIRGRFGSTILHDLAPSRKRMQPDEGVQFAEALLDAGARLDVRDELLKSTPLGWSCRWGRVELVKVLLDRGADPVEADAEPWATPRVWAEKMGHEDVLKLLPADGVAG